ncbi:pyridoxamine 5'-phosphate oxidase [Methylovorus sp. MM2]|uniref:HugZ family pyridoxamine 5'-phosphate oxidase n=1 Tax=Methylovorus sp. MM2 TaxID=1848038 RepID=UPI0007DF9D26|nr:DUF2470 domain-containing protein [Methylovorus sp. MM2]OAM52670.1 pyridoxamine 5'-phosphate oxidase [Methylovorus sp. MM2]
MNLSQEANQFLYSTRHGVLSTVSAKHAGYPFGSVTPFVVDHTGQPIMLISTLAEHTKNIQTNSKVSLLVFSGADDLQANARLTLIGNAHVIVDADAALKARYLRYLPQAASYFEMHDFSFYRIHIEHARYIGGFGKISWIAKSDLLPPENYFALQEDGIVEHMNTDHQDSLIAYAKHFKQISAAKAEMLGIDCFGFDVKATTDGADTHYLRFDFETPATDANSARKALVSMAHASRENEG